VATGRDIEAAVPPPVPNGGEEHLAVTPVRCEHGDDPKLEQIAQVREVEPSSHGGDASADKPGWLWISGVRFSRLGRAGGRREP
jgi:hypothetical protein